MSCILVPCFLVARCVKSVFVSSRVRPSCPFRLSFFALLGQTFVLVYMRGFCRRCLHFFFFGRRRADFCVFPHVCPPTHHTRLPCLLPSLISSPLSPASVSIIFSPPYELPQPLSSLPSSLREDRWVPHPTPPTLHFCSLLLYNQHTRVSPQRFLSSN